MPFILSHRTLDDQASPSRCLSPIIAMHFKHLLFTQCFYQSRRNMTAYLKIACKVKCLLLGKQHPGRLERRKSYDDDKCYSYQDGFFLHQTLNIAISLMHISFHLHQSQFFPINSTYRFEFSNKRSITKYCLILVFEMSKEKLLECPFYEISLAETLG